ncbi:MAG: hypothetical protein F4166_08855 [Gammaproteobacteria bacterium]|nr:hypothetical protein [Gammaproteobacteria bacterium]
MRNSRLFKELSESVSVVEYDDETDEDMTIVSSINAFIRLQQTSEDILGTGQFVEAGKYVGIILKPDSRIKEGMIITSTSNNHPSRLNILSQQTVLHVQLLVMEIRV